MASISLDELRKLVLARFSASPQMLGQAGVFLKDIETGADGLGKLGFNLLFEVPDSKSLPLKPDLYPRMLYKRRELGYQIANSEAEEKKLRADGWNEFPGGEKPKATPEPEPPHPSTPPVVIVGHPQLSGAMPLELPK